MAENKKKQSFAAAFVVIVFMFFFWGFVAASNGVLIPALKKHFSLSIFLSQFVDLAFYIAYFVGSLIYFFVSQSFGDPINKIGYKKGLMLGLIVSALGAFLFIPAVNLELYQLFLCGLFTLGLGFALLQIVANPFVINLGDPSKGSHRLNLAGGINSLGTTLGPLLLGFVLSKVVHGAGVVSDVAEVKSLYSCLGVILLILAGVISIAKMPAIKNESQELINETSTLPFPNYVRKSVFEYPQLVLGMVAIFVYVGTEVAIPSLLGVWLENPQIASIGRTPVVDHNITAKFISLYWGSLMIGRMSGALGAFNLKKSMYYLLSVLVPFLIFALIILANTLKDFIPLINSSPLANTDGSVTLSGNFESFSYIVGGYVSEFKMYLFWIFLFVIIKLYCNEKPAKTLLFFGIAAMCFMLLGLFSKGDVVLFAFISGGLFCSVMWPCIFNLSIAGLGAHTTKGSSLLIMMILGGAIIPAFIQAPLAEVAGIHQSYWVPFAGFAYLAWYGYYVRRILQKQGIDYDATTGTGH